MDLTALTKRLETRAKAFLSNPDEAKPEYIDIAIGEAAEIVGEIAGETTNYPIFMDIAFYRFLLLCQTNGVSEEQFKAYQQALTQIKTPLPSQSVKGTSRVKTRVNPYR